MIGAPPSNKGRGQGGGEPSGFDFVEVQDTAGAPPADATDRVDAGGEASGWSAGFDRAVGRGTAALGQASARLGSTGFAVLTGVALAAFVAVIAATPPQSVIEVPVPATRVPVAASCPSVGRCYIWRDTSGRVASAVAAQVHLTSFAASSTTDVDTGRVFRTVVFASNASQQLTVTSECMAGVVLPYVQPIRIEHVSSPPAGFDYLTATLVRKPNCWVLINATVHDSAMQRALTELINLSLDPDIWVR